MKKFLLALIVLLGWTQLALAQTTTFTPNLNLALPPAAPGTWGEQLNNNFTILDSAASGHKIREEGSDLPSRRNLNFIGAGVTASDNASTNSTDVTISITGAGHTIKDETSALTQRPTLTFIGSGVNCVDSSGNNATECTIAAGSVDQAAAYTWTGAHSWRSNNWSLLDSGDTSKILKWDISGFSTSTTRTMTLPNASTRILGESDYGATNGVLARTAAGIFTSRSILGTTNRITVTNGDFGAGSPVLDVGSLVVLTNQSNTYTAGDQDMGAAASFKFPIATGATPTVSGRCAYDSTSNRLKCGFNGATVTLAVTSEIQPLNGNLTALAGVTGSNNGVPVFTGPGAMTQAILPSCADTGGQHLNYDSTSHLWSCGTSSASGVSGLTTGKLQKALSATTIGDSLVSESGSTVTVAGSVQVGASGPFLIMDTSAIASTDKTWTALNFSGTIRPSTGAFTAGHVITVDANGLLVDGGVAGSGTWTDSSASTGTNKVIDVEAAGNVITTVSKIWLPTAGGTAAAPSLLWDTLATNAPTASCVEGSTVTTLLSCKADFPDSDGDYSLQQPILLPSDWTGNIDLKFMWRAAAITGDAVWQATLLCRADGEVDDGGAFNAANTVTDTTKGTANQLNTASISSMTLTNCSAGELAHLKVFRNRTHASDTIAGVISLVGVEVTMRRAQ